MIRAELIRQIREDWPEIRVAAARRGAVATYFSRLPERVELLGSALKIEKGEKKGYLSKILYLPPAKRSGVNICAWSTPECAASCLGDGAGQLSMSPARNARLWRMALLRGRSNLFRDLLWVEIQAHEARAKRIGKIPAIRLDGSSDLGLARRFAPRSPGVVFYDYTKSLHRTLAPRPVNWNLTFSFSGYNHEECDAVLLSGGNVAVVFDGPPPPEWRGYPVIDGDETDLRHLDPPGTVGGLKFKAAADRSSKLEAARPFVQPSNPSRITQRKLVTV